MQQVDWKTSRFGCLGWLLAAIIFSNGSLLGQEADSFFDRAQKAYQAKDYPTYLGLLKGAVEGGVDAPQIVFQLAGAYALTSQPTEAVAQLEKLANLGLCYDVKSRPDFSSLKNNPAFQKIAARLAHNKSRRGRSTHAFTIPEKDLIPEGIAYDPGGKTFYVGSLYKRKIVALNEKGAVREFSSGEDGLWDVVGLTVDVGRRALWVCSVAYYGTGPETGSTGVFRYDLKTGKLAAKYVLAGKPNEHGFNDLVVARDGDVFITDSSGLALYTIPRQTNQLEPFFSSPDFIFPNGITLSTDQKRILVASYQGIFSLDRESKKLTRLATPANVTTAGIDGMYLHGNTIIAVQNGVEPERVIRFQLDSAGTAVVRAEVLEANHPQFAIPTTATVANGWLYFFANTQLDQIKPDRSLTAPEKLKDVVILKTKL